MISKIYNSLKTLIKINFKLFEINNRIGLIEDSHERYEESLNHLKSVNEDFQTSLENINQMIKTMQTSFQDFHIRLADLENKIIYMQTQFADFQVNLGNIENKTDGIQSSFDSSNKILFDLQWRSQNVEYILFGNIVSYKLRHNNNYQADLCKARKIAISIDKVSLANKHLSLNYLFPNKDIIAGLDEFPKLDDADIYIIWGIKPQVWTAMLANKAIEHNKPLLICEDGFFRAVFPYVGNVSDVSLQYSVSFTLDSKTAYYDSTQPSDLELLLNSDLIVTDEQLVRSRNLINLIIKNKLSKYNHQPIFTPEIGQPGRKKVLVLDQSYGDYSIIKGSACDKVFEKMLETAISENSDADILVKVHPDTLMGGPQTGYYSNLQDGNNIYVLSIDINPISLIEYVDHVYVVTSQMGFEAVMCGKKVSVFGLPFYSGWGVTDDRQICKRRVKRRSVEEIFYITYILYSKYVNPKTGKSCEIEEALDYLLNQRKQYFGL